MSSSNCMSNTSWSYPPVGAKPCSVCGIVSRIISSIASDSFKGVNDIKGGFAKPFKSGCVSGLWVSVTASGIVVSSIADVAANVDAPWALASSLWGIEVSTETGDRMSTPDSNGT